MHGALLGIDDQLLVEAVRRVEAELFPGLIVGRDDLDHERRGGRVHRVWTGAQRAPVGDAVVALLAHVEEELGRPPFDVELLEDLLTALDHQ
jgi:hypothetical protein